MSSTNFYKYPRTAHLEGSRRQPGDEEAGQVALNALTDGTFVWEEKLDGANAAVSFRRDGSLQLQSRGHVLRGGGREAQFALLKAWAEAQRARLSPVLGSRYIVFGEWCFAKHTVFYDCLPHYFIEFDVYDRERAAFLSTPARRQLIEGLPIVSVPVVHEGRVVSSAALRKMVGPSRYKSAHWRRALASAAAEAGQPPALIEAQTDMSDLAEGLYLKHEAGDVVIGRYKFIRSDFLQSVVPSGSHWQDRPITPNKLATDVDIFA
ncbi:MAG: RNA ligase family protein [Hyphomicrobiaceae bacterium]